eukprot:maker-scaffold_28-augustus-gene-3.75-mRNA-1 protein AED:0.57 eAED:0.57 QI:0/0/0/0.5/1/1/2/0/419
MALSLLTDHLFKFLEELCLLRSGTDEFFLSNLNKKKAFNDKFELDRKNKNGFIVRHFAVETTYSSEGFVEKNRDALTTDLKELVQNNSIELLAEQIGTTPEERTRKMAAKETVLKKFQKDMNNLVSTISKTDETFIRCIKPNPDQSEHEWDVNLVLSQLGYLGIIQAIRVRQETYPIRRNFSFIAEKYHSILEGEAFIEYSPGKNDLQVMRAILIQHLGDDSEFKLWQCGHTKRRAAALAAMSEDDRHQKLEEEKLKQEKELKEAREKFERENAEEELRRKRLEEEKQRREEEERLRRLKAEEEGRPKRMEKEERLRQLKAKEEEQRRFKIRKREWSEAAEIFLVGNVYNWLAGEGSLDDHDAWENIFSGFCLDCKQAGEMNGLYRTIEEMERHFERMVTSGEYDLDAMYQQWLKSKTS